VTTDQQRFTIAEVAADWHDHELMEQQRIKVKKGKGKCIYIAQFL